MAQTFRLEKGSALTYGEADDNLRFPHLWNIAKTFRQGMVVFDGSDYYYLCTKDVSLPNTIALNNTTYWKRLFSLTNIGLNDLSDVVITSPQIGQTIRWNGTEFVNSGADLIDVTHTQLNQLRSQNKIIPGAFYRLEYQNKHTIAGTNNEYIGPIEKLVLFGVSTNNVSNTAYSETHPGDLIIYNPDNVSTTLGTTRPGFIERRTNVKHGISLPYDFRNTKVRRLKGTAPLWTATTAYTKGQVVKNGNTYYGCYRAHTSTTSFSTDSNSYWIELFSLTTNIWDEYFIPTTASSFIIGGFSIPFSTGTYQDFDVFAHGISNCYGIYAETGLPGVTGDLIFGESVNDISISKGAYGITFGNLSNGIKTGLNATKVYFDFNSTDCEAGNGSSGIFFGSNNKNNKAEAGSSSVVFANGSKNNTVISSNTVSFGNDCESNFISSSNSNYFGRNCKGNKLTNVITGEYGQGTSNNELERVVTITLQDNSFRNKVSDAVTITIGVNSEFNEIKNSNIITIGESCLHNEIAESGSTSLGNSCWNNKLINSDNTTFGESCKGNYFKDSHSAVLSTGCYDNEVVNTNGFSLPSSSWGNKVINVGFVSLGTTGSPIYRCRLIDSSSITISTATGTVHDIYVEQATGTVQFFGNNSKLKLKNVQTVSIGSNVVKSEVINCTSSVVISANSVNVKVDNGNIISVSGTDVVIKDSSNVTVSSGSSNIRVINSDLVSIGTGCQNITVVDSGSAGNSITIGEYNFSVKVENSLLVTTGTNVQYVTAEVVGSVTIGQNVTRSTIRHSSIITLEQNSERNVVEYCSSVTISSGSAYNIIKNSSLINKSGAAILSNSILNHCSSLTYSANLNYVSISQSFANKTIQANWTGVEIRVPDFDTKTYSTVMSNKVFDKKAPDGSLWCSTVNDLGEITTVKLV